MVADTKHEKCDRCGALGNDRRTLWMACFYAMNELGLPFKEIGLHGVIVQKSGTNSAWGFAEFEKPASMDDASTRALYTLRVCKGCRGGWMGAIKKWFRGQPEDFVAWNNDASVYGEDDDLPKLLAKSEQLKTEIIALEQRAAAIRETLYAEEQRRLDEDRRP